MPGCTRRVKSNDNVTEAGSFRQMIMLPAMSPPFKGRCGSRSGWGGKAAGTFSQAKTGHQGSANIFGHSRDGTRQGGDAVDQVVDLLAQLAGLGLLTKGAQLLCQFLRDRLRRAQTVEGSGCLVEAALDP